MTFNVISPPKTSRYFCSKISEQDKMIIEKLLKAANDTQLRLEQENGRLKAIKSIREILSDIDFTAEVVPVEDEDRLIRLLVSLRGKPLAKNEIDLINEIVKN